MSMSKSSGSAASAPVSPEELQYMQDLMTRLRAQGYQGPMPDFNALRFGTGSEENMLTHGSMTGACKRGRATSPLPGADSFRDTIEAEVALEELSEFSLVTSSPTPKSRLAQLPLAPAVTGRSEEIKLPPGVDSVQQWGSTLCEMPKMKSLNLTYEEIAQMPEHRSYAQWVISQGKGKGGRCEDFRNYLLFSGFMADSKEGTTFPGSSEIRRFKK